MIPAALELRYTVVFPWTDGERETSTIDILKEKDGLKLFHFTGNDGPVIALSVWPDVIFMCQEHGWLNLTQFIPQNQKKKKRRNYIFHINDQ